MDLSAHGVRANALELATVAEAEALLKSGEGSRTFVPAELSYAHSKSDPARRLAARLAAKRAAASLLLEAPELIEIEVTPSRGGPPGLRFHGAARAAFESSGATRALVSLTHGVEHAAAWVLFLGR